MGHNISVLSYHKLDTSSVEKTGQELAVRFGVNVECYYRDNYDPELFSQNDFPSYDEHLLATYSTPGAAQTWQLYDEHYIQKQLWVQQGEKLMEHPFYKNNQTHTNELMHAIRCVQYELYYRTDEDVEWLADIHGRLWQCEFHYFGRWWDLGRCFMDADWHWKVENLNDFRKKLRSTLKIMGAESAIYADDQGDSGIYTDKAYEAESWDDFVTEIKTRFGDECMNVSDFIKLGVPMKNDDYPTAFYDDFKDMDYSRS